MRKNTKKKNVSRETFLGTVLILLLFLLIGCGQNSGAPLEISTPTGENVLVTPVETQTSQPTEEPTPEPTLAPTPSPAPLPLAGIVIGVDPGHQKIYDPTPERNAPWSDTEKARVAGGCRGVVSRMYEYEVVLEIGLRLRDLLVEQGATVIMTREVQEINISNKERAELFNAHEVDLGIRLHCNNGRGRGAFMLVPKKGGTDWYTENVAAAKTIIAIYCEDTGLPMIRSKDDGITYRSDQTGFNWSTRPVVGIEMGHLSDKEDDALFSDPAFWDVAAAGLCRGITEYFTAQQNIAG